jgi:ABC-type transport system involved in cytochrome bd biosynthesis fused ATPase/permease subunit
MSSDGMEKSDPYVRRGMEMVLMRWIFFAGVMGRSLMSSMDCFVFVALAFWIEFQCALVVLIAKPSVLKVLVSV